MSERILTRQLGYAAGAWRQTPRDYFYASPFDFVMREGELFVPAPCPERLVMVPGYCYGNALVMSLVLELPYVEGYALPAANAMPVPHAWNLDENDKVVDSTWARGERDFRPAGRAYMGVRFSADRADDCTWNGDTCVLDDWKRRWPLLREQWQPEDSPGPVEHVIERVGERHEVEGAGGLPIDEMRAKWAA